MPIVLGILASGRGSNVQAIIDAIEEGTLDARIALVACNRAGAQVLERCATHRIESLVLLQRDFPSRTEHQLAIARAFLERGVELVVGAGWDRILTSEFLQAFPDRVINVHPSLLPAFAGTLTAQQDALDYGVAVSGCTVHFMNDDVDGGAIILQKIAPVFPADTVETLSARILQQEHKALPEAIQLFAEGRVRIQGRKAVIAPPA
jgi:phosphoribosylglycinamide formyltransferase-1